MVAGLTCRLCGRANTGGNLNTYLDELTQDVFITEDGYVFQNPYWHKRLIPDPEGFEMICGFKNPKKDWAWEGGLLHKNQKPLDNGQMELVEDVEAATDVHLETIIRLQLQKFKYKWILTNSILCNWPTAYHKWAEEATFMLRPVNEDLPYWGWVRASIETRYQYCNYQVVKEDKDGKWKEMENPPGDKKENPNVNEIAFLDRCWKLHLRFANEFTYTFEGERKNTMYNDDKVYLNDVKDILKEFSVAGEGGKWDGQLTIQNYKELRFLMFLELKKLIAHIEKKLDHTRKDFELYLPKKLIRVNDERVIIQMQKDFVYEWWPKTYALLGLWQFAKRPFTKRQLEEWNEKKFTGNDGVEKVQKYPLMSCIFCPDDEKVGTDDYSFDNWSLLQSDDKQSQTDLVNGRNAFISAFANQNSREIAEALADLVEDGQEMSEWTDEQLITCARGLGEITFEETIDREVRESIDRSRIKFDKILIDRKGLQGLKDKLREEREADEARREQVENRLRDLQTQIQGARDSNNASEVTRLEGELNNQMTEATNVARRLESNSQRTSEFIDVVNNNTSRYRESINRINDMVDRMRNRD